MAVGLAFTQQFLVVRVAANFDEGIEFVGPFGLNIDFDAGGEHVELVHTLDGIRIAAAIIGGFTTRASARHGACPFAYVRQIRSSGAGGVTAAARVADRPGVATVIVREAFAGELLGGR